MANNLPDEDILQCVKCLCKFRLSSGRSREDGDICGFCRREQLIQELKRTEEECKKTAICPNPDCKMAIPQALVNEHRVECMFSHFSCPYTNCDFRGTKPEADEHTGSCEHRRVPCPDCGRGLSVAELEEHKRDCRELVKCEHCGMLVSNSSKKTHDDWICPQQAMWSFCRDCKKVFSYAELEQHREACLVQDVQEELFEEPPMPRKPDRKISPVLVYDRDTELAEYHQGDETKPKRRHLSAQSRLADIPSSDLPATPVPRSVLLDALSAPGRSPEPYMRSSLGISRSPVQVSPTARARWRMLMSEIEAHQDMYREQLQLPRPTRTVSV